MKTVLIEPDEYLLAVEFLAKETLVVIPTETVYGLGASALSDHACKLVYKVKERPEDNPLIVHCSDIPMALECMQSDDASSWRALKILSALAPAPVTVVVKASDYVCKTALAGGDTVAIRIPDHRLFHRIITALGQPIAAPSANMSGKPSATNPLTAWEAMYGKVEGVVDGGICRMGIESTIVDCTKAVPQIIRLGAIHIETISRAIQGKVREYDRNIYAIDEAKFEGNPAAKLPSRISIIKTAKNKKQLNKEFAIVPGSKYKHYSPLCKIVPIISWAKTDVLVDSGMSSLLLNDDDDDVEYASQPTKDSPFWTTFVHNKDTESKYFDDKNQQNTKPKDIKKTGSVQFNWVDSQGNLWKNAGNVQRTMPQHSSSFGQKIFGIQNKEGDLIQRQLETIAKLGEKPIGLCIVGKVQSHPPNDTYALYRHYETYEALTENLYELFVEADRRRLKVLYIDCPKIKRYPALYDRIWRACRK